MASHDATDVIRSSVRDEELGRCELGEAVAWRICLDLIETGHVLDRRTVDDDEVALCD